VEASPGGRASIQNIARSQDFDELSRVAHLSAARDEFALPTLDPQTKCFSDPSASFAYLCVPLREPPPTTQNPAYLSGS
jgi:hypothetical protein